MGPFGKVTGSGVFVFFASAFCRFGEDESTTGTVHNLKTRCTLVNSPLCYCIGGAGQTAGVKPEEGGDDVKSSWPCRNKVAVGEESGWITSFLRILSIVRMATSETENCGAST